MAGSYSVSGVVTIHPLTHSFTHYLLSTHKRAHPVAGKEKSSRPHGTDRPLQTADGLSNTGLQAIAVF